MRKASALLLALALIVQPAIAQTKTKASPADAALAALEVCETFARGDAMAVDAAIEAGWDAYDQEAESPFIRSYSASRDIPGLGWGDLFALVESYPDRTLGYCRLDVAEARGKRDEAIEALAGLDRYEGEVKTENDGVYASLKGTDQDAMLMTHWDDIAFVIQLTILTPKSGEP